MPLTAERIGVNYTKYETPGSGALEEWKKRVRSFGGRIFDGDWKALRERRAGE